MKKLKLAVGIVTMAVALSGCSWFGDSEARKAVKEGFDNLAEVKMASYDLGVDGSITPAEKEAGKLTLNLDFDGAYDNSKKDEPKLSVRFSGSGGVGDSLDGNLAAGGELRIFANKLYFMVNEVSKVLLPGSGDTFESFKNVWWYVDLPEELVKQFQHYSGDEAQLTDEEKKLKKLSEETMFFEDEEYVGEETVGGVAASKYNVTLDEETLKDYLNEASKIVDEKEISKETMADFDKAMKAMEFTGSVWIGKENKTAIKVVGTLKVKELEKLKASMEFEVSYMVSDLNQPVTIEAPEAKEFTQQELMKLLVGSTLQVEAVESSSGLVE